mmetsp:Transcript_9099/g.11562  ORF Transcript_9099/g.11562 Transcript_9099/m.11562 type:complete len:213 (-) Transcript_9099:626-1264(-)
MSAKVSGEPLQCVKKDPGQQIEFSDETERLKADVEATWGVLHFGGLKKKTLQPKPIQNKYSPSDANVLVDIGLERPKDANNANRVELAHACKRDIEKILSHSFTAQQPSKLILYARIALASERSVLGRVWAAEFGFGHAKLVVLWCLQVVETGQVVSGRRVVKTDSLAIGFADCCNSNAGPDAVVRLANRTAYDITREVLRILNHEFNSENV